MSRRNFRVNVTGRPDSQRPISARCAAHAAEQYVYAYCLHDVDSGDYVRVDVVSAGTENVSVDVLVTIECVARGVSTNVQ